MYPKDVKCYSNTKPEQTPISTSQCSTGYKYQWIHLTDARKRNCRNSLVYPTEMVAGAFFRLWCRRDTFCHWVWNVVSIH